MREVRITFKNDWVYSHRNDAELPVKQLKNMLVDGKSIEYIGEGLLFLELNYDENKYSETELRSYIYKAILTLYDGDDASLNQVFDLSFPDEEKEAKQQEKHSSLSKAAAARCEKLKQDLEKVDELVGADEFKALIHELHKIALGMLKRGTNEVFKYQSYLFSIGDGMGMTTYAELFAQNISNLGLAKICASRAVVERSIQAPKDSRNIDGAFEDAESIFENVDFASTKIVVIDISEMMDKTGSERFRQFLKRALCFADEYIYIFRIPYVEKDVLENVRASLSDILSVRAIAIPPLCNEDISIVAKRELERYGFKSSGAGKQYFMQRISEEKSDGKFYGFNTVKKVVRELVYGKELSIAKSGKASNTITASDTRSLCAQKQETKLGFEQLDSLIGCDNIKKQINQVLAQIELAKAEGIKTPCMHMRFVGNPGTGKTTVARILGRIFKEKGVLRIGNFYEYSGRDFCGIYIGETAPKTAGMCRDAYGSVLFIDEAYTLYRSSDSNSKDYGREAIDTLIAEMENHKDDLIVIMAGYTDDMDKLLDGNQGLKSRIPYTIEFPNFTREQLYDIYVSMLKGKFGYEEGLLDAARRYFDELPDEIYEAKEFGNARFVRNLFERTWAKASLRCELDRKSGITLTAGDFLSATSDKEFSLNEKKKKVRLGFY